MFFGRLRARKLEQNGVELVIQRNRPMSTRLIRRMPVTTSASRDVLLQPGSPAYVRKEFSSPSPNVGPERILRTAASQFNGAVRIKDLKLIRSTYRKLSVLGRDQQKSGCAMDAETLTALYLSKDLLTQGKEDGNASVLKDLTEDLERIWLPAFGRTIADVTDMAMTGLVRQLCERGEQELAMELLELRSLKDAELKRGRTSTSGRWKAWEQVLLTIISLGDPAAVASVAVRMHSSDVAATASFYNTALSFFLTINPLPIEEISTCIAAMNKDGVKQNSQTRDIIAQAFADASLLDLAAEISLGRRPIGLSMLKALARLRPANRLNKRAANWNRLLAGTANEITKERMTEMKVGAKGEVMPVDFSEVALHKSAQDSSSWPSKIEELLRACAGPVRADRAFAAYQVAKQQGHCFTGQTVLPLIRELLPWPSFTRPALDKAMSVYKDLCESYPTSGSADAQLLGPTVDLYYKLVEGLVAHGELGSAREMLTEMEQRKRHFPATALNGLLRRMVHAAPDHKEAFLCYAHAWPLGPHLVNYTAVLTHFIEQSYPSSPYPLPEYVFEMIEDMQRALHAQNPNYIVATLLTRYKNIAADARRSEDSSTQQGLLKGVAGCVYDVHDRMKLNISFTPDSAVYSALLDAYNHLHAFGDCFRLWDEIRMNRRSIPINHSMVSIIIDVCGYSESGYRAQTIWKQLRDEHYPLNRRNWNSYVECLAKLGSKGFELAEDIVMTRMGEKGDEQDLIPPADIETARILLKYSFQYGQKNRSHTERLVREKLPEIHAQLISSGFLSLGDLGIPDSSDDI